MAKRFIRTLLVSIIIVCTISQSVVFAESTVQDKDLEYLKSVMEMIKEKYNGQVTDKQLVEGAMKGMFGSMDPYTVYWTPEEADSFFNSIGGTFGGIGIVMEKVGDYIQVAKVYEGSPAEKSGLSIGDKIVEADGKSLVGVSYEEAGGSIKGEIGTKVILGVIKSGGTEVVRIELTRDLIKISPVAYNIIGDIAYIRLDSFNSNSNEYISKVMRDIDSKGITKVILDLRNNPGGLVDQAVAIARKFVPEGIITKLNYRTEEYRDIEYRSYLKNLKYKLAVLVNENSASASEILAGAIQDTKAGTLIGTKTFGKAKVQVIIPILTEEAFEKYEKQVGAKLIDAYQLIQKYGIAPMESEITGHAKITVGEYTTPNGRMIDQQGLTPDISVENDKDSEGIDVTNVSWLSKNVSNSYPTEGMDVYNAEKILKLAGYEISAPDMMLDDQSVKAIEKFQSDCGLLPLGILDYSTMSALNKKLSDLIDEKDKQLSNALQLLKN